MRTPLLLALGALLLAGCDVVREGSFSKKPGYMERLDGTWNLQVSQHTISTTGAVTDTPAPVGERLQIGENVQCNRIDVEAAGESDRVMRRETAAGALVRCHVITVDETLDRVIFVGESTGSRDFVYNLVENEADRQVWSAFAPQTDGRVFETRWTLTR